MNSPTKILESKIKVRFQHCDPFGHLNNATYIDYFLNAREDQLSAYYDFNTYAYSREENKAWVVASHHIDYLIPVKAMQELTIRSFVKSYTDKAIDVVFAMVHGDKTYSRMLTTFVHVDLKTGKPQVHNEYWLSFLSNIVCG